jgi:hypothetical protein
MMSTALGVLTSSEQQSLNILCRYPQWRRVSSEKVARQNGFCYTCFTMRTAFLRRFTGGYMNRILTIIVGFGLLSAAGCSSGSLTTREKGAGIGALGGAAVGGIIGAAVGRPGAGAAIGGALGLGSGALVGDQLQGQEQKQSEQQRQIDANQAELERQRRDLERLKRTGEY